MKITSWYSDNFERNLRGRYITLKHINPILEKYKKQFEISVIGTSELGKKISMIKIGTGKNVILAWSQMHGNESTTTKSIFDLLKFFSEKKHFQKEINIFLKSNTLYIIPILNPDGAELYTRLNANLIDLNRDAQNLTQKESQVLATIFNKVQPDLCLNLHGQRSIFGLETGKPATISFLSPASNKEREVTSARKIAMKLIANASLELSKYIPGQIGRYDDSFNHHCFGDCFQMNDVPVILFEAGHLGNDYQREKTRLHVFYALLSVLELLKSNNESTYKDYFLIPENKKNFNDVVIRNVRLNENSEPVSLAIQFTEELIEGGVHFVPKIEAIDDLINIYGHQEIVGKGDEVLLNSQEKIEIGAKVLKIVSKKDKTLVYFDVKNILF